MVILPVRFSHLCRGLPKLSYSDRWFLGHLLARLLSLAGGPTLERVLVVPNFSTTIEATVLLVTLGALEMV